MASSSSASASSSAAPRPPPVPAAGVGMLKKLEQISYSQAQSSILPVSQQKYVCYVRKTTEIITKLGKEMQELCFVHNENGQIVWYKGQIANIRQLKMPISPDVIKLLFAAISKDGSLARSSRKTAGSDPSESSQQQADVLDFDADSSQIVTVAAQSYQNYKSGLKWFSTYDNQEWGENGSIWLPECDEVFKVACASYKRDVGAKKRDGIMKFESGKLAYDLNGYEALSIYFKSMKPDSKRYTFAEGMFCDLFTKLSVNSIGRSDNIDDVQFKYITWMGDAWAVKFGTTKADQEGEACEWKRMYCNIFKPHCCVSLSLSVYLWCTPIPEHPLYLFAGKEQHKRYYHFTQDGLNVCAALGWDNILPGYRRLPESFQRVIPYLFALIIYQRGKGVLSEIYPSEHPFFCMNVSFLAQFPINAYTIDKPPCDVLWITRNSTTMPITEVSKELYIFASKTTINIRHATMRGVNNASLPISLSQTTRCPSVQPCAGARTNTSGTSSFLIFVTKWQAAVTGS
jgi:hypothetical protein